MNEQAVKRRVIEPPQGCDPDVGRWLWALEDARKWTLKEVEGLSDEALYASPPVGENTIAGLLYHMAAIEASWLYEDTLQQPFPPEVEVLFPYDVRDEQRFLWRPESEDLASYLHRLEVVRTKLLEAFNVMTVEEFRRVRTTPEGLEVTPEWVLYHVMEHEIEHRGHLQVIIESLGVESKQTG